MSVGEKQVVAIKLGSLDYRLCSLGAAFCQQRSKIENDDQGRYRTLLCEESIV
jgi:hypothetical protein